MDVILAVCDHCGARMQCPDTDAGKRVLCCKCLRPLVVPALPAADDLQLEGVEECHRHVRDDFFTGSFKEAPAMSPSITTPAAPPALPKDTDKALANVALGIFRLNSWPCHEEPGYRSFTARVKFHSAQLGVTTVDNFRVCAEKGLLILESPVIELPPLPGVPLLETLNEINQRTVSAVFYLNDQGVTMRHAVIPRAKEEGYFTGAMIKQVLRQMTHDRRHALSLLRQTVETRKLDPVAIAQAFAHPLAPCALHCHTLDEAADLASFAGLYALKVGSQICLGRELAAPDKCPVRLTAANGFLRGWVTLGDVSRFGFTWSFIPPKIRGMFKSMQMLAGDHKQLLASLNTLNSASGLLRYVSTRKHIAATASAYPTDHVMTVEEFQTFASALLENSGQGTLTPAAPLAKAG